MLQDAAGGWLYHGEEVELFKAKVKGLTGSSIDSGWYGSDYYGLGDVRDPRGPTSGTMRIVRGGSWVNDNVSMLRSAYRHKVPPDTYAYSVGFRVVCEP